MKRDLRFLSIYSLAGIIISLASIAIVLVLYILHVEAEESYSAALFFLSWTLAMSFGLRARRHWAHVFNQTVLAIASVGLLAAFFVRWHPLALLLGVAAVACFTYFYRAREVFPPRTRIPAAEALQTYSPTEKEQQTRGRWLIGARIYLGISLFVAIGYTILGIYLCSQLGPTLLVGLLMIGFGAFLVWWRFHVIKCAHGGWGTRMSLWETISSGASLAMLVCRVGPLAIAATATGMWWVTLLWAVGVAFGVYYFITSYRLRQINLRFRAHREALTGPTATATT